MVSWIIAVAAWYFIHLPAICIGGLALLTYYAATKILPAAGRLLPIALGLFLPVLALVAGSLSLPVDFGVMAMGVLTPFMFVERYFPERHRYTILFVGSILAGSIRFINGLAMASDGGSPIFHLLTSMTSSDAGFLIMNSVALYLEMAICSALIFGVVLVAVAAWRKMPGKF